MTQAEGVPCRQLRAALPAAGPAGALVCLLAMPLAAAPMPLTLDEALRLAAAAPAARTLDLQVDRAAADVHGVGLWPNPQASFSREVAGDVEQVTSLSQAFPWPGRLSLEKDAARSGVRAAGEDRRQARAELGARVREAFQDLLAAQGRTAVLEEGVGRLDELVAVLAAREKEGEASGYDHMRAEREGAEVRADLLVARGRLSAARAALAALLSLPPDDLWADGSLETPRSLPALADVLQAAESRGDVEALAAGAQGADLLARAAGKRAIPELTVEAGVKTSEAAGVRDHGSEVGLSLTLPLFDHGQGPRAAAQVEAQLFRARRETLRRQAGAEAEAAWHEARARQEAEAAYTRAPDPEQLVAIARAAYDAGETRILDLLDAYRASLTARLRAIDLQYEARRAETELDRAAGVDPLP